MAYPQLFGGKTVEYRLNSNNGWKIDFDDIESKMNDNVKLLVLINQIIQQVMLYQKNEINQLLI